MGFSAKSVGGNRFRVLIGPYGNHMGSFSEGAGTWRVRGSQYTYSLSKHPKATQVHDDPGYEPTCHTCLTSQVGISRGSKP